MRAPDLQSNLDIQTRSAYVRADSTDVKRYSVRLSASYGISDCTLAASLKSKALGSSFC